MAVQVAAPRGPVRLIFVHHSCGENLLADADGGLGIALRDNGYVVSDTNYTWGPKAIGDFTDIGHLWTWFRGPDSADYLRALYIERGQHSAYTRSDRSVAGENTIILFKGCYPNSMLRGDPDAAIPPIQENPLRGESCWTDHHTVANAKGIYVDLLEYFRSRPDKLFVILSAPPVLDPQYASNTRAFNRWLATEWLRAYPPRNVAVFDLFHVLTGEDHHHLLINGTIQHTGLAAAQTIPSVLHYPAKPGNNHPNRTGNQKATADFVPLLNLFYNRWRD